MSTNNDGWIWMSERRPAKADLPVWVCDNGEPPHLFTGCVPGDLWEYWKPAAADIPAPPREKTQAQKDEGAWADWYLPRQDAPTSNEGWHAALAYERAEVGKMLPPVRSSLANFATVADDAINAIEAIRARCGGGK